MEKVDSPLTFQKPFQTIFRRKCCLPVYCLKHKSQIATPTWVVWVSSPMGFKVYFFVSTPRTKVPSLEARPPKIHHYTSFRRGSHFGEKGQKQM